MAAQQAKVFGFLNLCIGLDLQSGVASAVWWELAVRLQPLQPNCD